MVGDESPKRVGTITFSPRERDVILVERHLKTRVCLFRVETQIINGNRVNGDQISEWIILRFIFFLFIKTDERGARRDERSIGVAAANVNLKRLCTFARIVSPRWRALASDGSYWRLVKFNLIE